MGQCVSCTRSSKRNIKKLNNSFCSARFSLHGSFIDDNYYCDMKQIFLMPTPGNPHNTTEDIVHRDAGEMLIDYFCDCEGEKKHLSSCSTVRLGLNMSKSTFSLVKSSLNLHNVDPSTLVKHNKSNKRLSKMSMMSLNRMDLSTESLMLSLYDLNQSFNE